MHAVLGVHKLTLARGGGGGGKRRKMGADTLRADGGKTNGGQRRTWEEAVEDGSGWQRTAVDGSGRQRTAADGGERRRKKAVRWWRVAVVLMMAVGSGDK